jgi:hypothetical protein
MPILQIYQDSKGRGTCRSCGASIEWAELVSGKRHPFDAPIVAMRSQGSILDGRVIEHVDTDASPTHFASCPQGKQWSRR